MTKPRRITRRAFGAQVAASGAALSLAAHGRSGAQANDETPPTEARKLRYAAVGVGGKGGNNLRLIAECADVEVVALCDVDENALNGAAQRFPNARKYRDWRELLATERENIDAVSVSTPDHMHAPIAMSAINLGKHVFCEKPLTHDVYETRQLTLAARKAGVVTQMDIQIHSYECYRRAVRIIQDGMIGKVKEWHSWITAGYSTPGMKRPDGEDPVPPHLDWDLWLGAVPVRPYKNEQYHPKNWRYWQDFGCGGLGDFGCHIFDPLFTALGLGVPKTIQAETPEFDREVWPSWEIVHYEFPGTPLCAAETIKATWYDGGKRPPDDIVALIEVQPFPESGSIIVGTEGAMLLPHYKDPHLFPSEKFKDYKLPDVGKQNHYIQWANACLGKDTTSAGFDYAGPLTETILVGDVAVRMGGKLLEWDSANLTFTNAPEANELLRRPYREGWSVEGLS